jgi:hypothetical protein
MYLKKFLKTIKLLKLDITIVILKLMILILKETKYTGAEMKSGAELIYTGRELTKRVSHVFKGPFYGLKENWVILSIKDID